MENPATLNGVKQKATKPKRCQEKECAKLGSLRSIIDSPGKLKWTYFMCDEHFRSLSEQYKQHIARAEGTKVA